MIASLLVVHTSNSKFAIVVHTSNSKFASSACIIYCKLAGCEHSAANTCSNLAVDQPKSNVCSKHVDRLVHTSFLDLYIVFANTYTDIG